MHQVSIVLPDAVATRRLQLACQKVASTSFPKIVQDSQRARRLFINQLLAAFVVATSWLLS